jgi:hypothetical protein
MWERSPATSDPFGVILTNQHPPAWCCRSRGRSPAAATGSCTSRDRHTLDDDDPERARARSCGAAVRRRRDVELHDPADPQHVRPCGRDDNQAGHGPRHHARPGARATREDRRSLAAAYRSPDPGPDPLGAARAAVRLVGTAVSRGETALGVPLAWNRAASGSRPRGCPGGRARLHARRLTWPVPNRWTPVGRTRFPTTIPGVCTHTAWR